MFKKEAELSAAKQLGLPDTYIVVYASIVINHVTDSDEMAKAVIATADAYRAEYPRDDDDDEYDEWLVHEAEKCINGLASDCKLPKGWFLVEMAEPDGDGYRPGKFGLVNLSEFYGDSDE